MKTVLAQAALYHVMAVTAGIFKKENKIKEGGNPPNTVQCENDNRISLFAKIRHRQ